MIFVVAALSGVEACKAMDEFDGFNPLEHFKSKLFLSILTMLVAVAGSHGMNLRL